MARRDYERIIKDGTGALMVHRGKVHKYLGMTLDAMKKQSQQQVKTDSKLLCERETKLVQHWTIYL